MLQALTFLPSFTPTCEELIVVRETVSLPTYRTVTWIFRKDGTYVAHHDPSIPLPAGPSAPHISMDSFTISSATPIQP